MIHNKLISSVLTVLSVLALGCLTASVSSCKKETEIKVQTVTVSQTAMVLTEGETAMISYTIEPNNAANKTVSFTSSDPGVATVNEAGLVTAVAPGKTTITVASIDGPKATVLVSVQAKAKAVTGVELDQTELTILEGETATLKATVAPSDASDKSVSWKSSNESIATVADGVVTGIKAGSAAITVTTNDGGKTATCVVTVQSATVAVTGVSLDKTELTMVEGESATLKATVTPEDATDKEVTWTSSQPSVATVTDGVIIAVAPGSTAITVTTNDGNKTATCAVTVVAKTIAVTGVSLDKTELTLTEGDTATLTATVTPADASDKSVTWTSSQPSVATVTDGVIVAVAPGKTAITVTTNDGGKTASCAVTVEAKVVEVSEVKVDISDVTLTEGENSKITVTIEPADATDKTVTFTSSDESVVKVDADGNITAVGPGTATITVTAGGKTATVTVTVNPAVVEVTDVKVDVSAVTLGPGEEATITVTVEPADATDKTVTFTSSDPSVATVDENGKITAVGPGTATITVTAGGKTTTVTVTVTASAVPVTGVALDKHSLTLTVGKDGTLKATVSPADASNKAVTWSSSDESIAKVDANGKVTGVKIGTAKITVTTVSGGFTDVCDVKVVADGPAVTGISVVPNTLELTVGESETPVVTILPTDAANKTVFWASDNKAVATVNENGKITAVGPGTATITATTEDGGYTADVYVTVKGTAIAVTGVVVTPATLTLTEGETSTLTASVTPSDASNKEVTWESSKTSVATVDANGKVTAVKEGTATITATTVDGGKKATCSVTVKSAKVPVTSVTITPTSLNIAVGETGTLTATVKPDNATDKTLKWSSSKTSVATVDANGKVTAKAEGTATITVTTNDGGKKATCAVTVVAATIDVTGITANSTAFVLGVGNTHTMIPGTDFTITPGDATYQTVDKFKWQSSKTSVATVGESTGVVTGKAAGSADIKAQPNPLGSWTSGYVKARSFSVVKPKIQIINHAGSDVIYLTEGTFYEPSQEITMAVNERVVISYFDGSDKQLVMPGGKYGSSSSSNTSVLAIDNTGVNSNNTAWAAIKAKSVGTSTLTLIHSGDNGYVSAKFTIKVIDPTSKFQWSDGDYISGSKTGKHTSSSDPWYMAKDYVQTIYALDSGANIYSESSAAKNITWKSKNTSIATVSPTAGASVKVTGVAAGTTEIVGTDSYGNTRSFYVLVYSGEGNSTPYSVGLSSSSGNVTHQMTKGVDYNLYPSSGFSFSVSNWKSSNTSVATVNSSSGLVTIPNSTSTGSSTISATYSAGYGTVTVSREVKRVNWYLKCIYSSRRISEKMPKEGSTYSYSTNELFLDARGLIRVRFTVDGKELTGDYYSATTSNTSAVPSAAPWEDDGYIYIESTSLSNTGSSNVTIKYSNDDYYIEKTYKVTIIDAFKWADKDIVVPSGDSYNLHPADNPYYRAHGSTFEMDAYNTGGSGQVTNPKIKWTSSDTSIATVEPEYGYYTKVTMSNTKAGIACITGTDSYGNTRTCYVTNGFKWSSGDIIYYTAGSTGKVPTQSDPWYLSKGNSVEVAPANSSQKLYTAANAEYVKWSSANTSVATVSPSTGKTTTIKALTTGNGLVEIKGTDSWGETRSYWTCVHFNWSTGDIASNSTSERTKTSPYYLTVGSTIKVRAYKSGGTAYTSDETFSSLTWSSADASIATVSPTSGNEVTVTGVAGGLVEIKAKDYNGTTRSFWVQVYSFKGNSTPYKVGCYNPEFSRYMANGIDYTISPSASLTNWASSNTTYATVNSSSGLVTYPSSAVGTTKITAKNPWTGTTVDVRTIQKIGWYMYVQDVGSGISGISLNQHFTSGGVETINVSGAAGQHIRFRFYDSSNGVDMDGKHYSHDVYMSPEVATVASNYEYLHINIAKTGVIEIGMRYSTDDYHIEKMFKLNVTIK